MLLIIEVFKGPVTLSFFVCRVGASWINRVLFKIMFVPLQVRKIGDDDM